MQSKNHYLFVANKIRVTLNPRFEKRKLCVTVDAANIFISVKLLFKERLCNLLKRDTFFALEEDIFNGVQRWITKNPEVDSATVLGVVRLPIIPLKELFTTVKKSGLLNSDQLLQVIEDKSNLSYVSRISNIEVPEEEFNFYTSDSESNVYSDNDNIF